jgi:hypothetical protein
MRWYSIAGLMIAVALCGCGRDRANQKETAATTATAAATQTSMTVVGCLIPDAETTERRPVGTSGNPPPPGFTLVNVTSPAPNSAARSYSLVADKDRLDDLQRFANSRVEVNGSIVASTGNGTADVGAASAPAGAPPNDVRRIRVTDVRQLESTCGEPKKK